jgi:hypothetical protein
VQVARAVGALALAFSAACSAGEADSERENGGSGPQAGSARRLTTALSYLGTLDNGAGCNREYAMSGFEPDVAPGLRYPLFLYFTGTNFVLDQATFHAQAAPAVDAVTEAMARRGFVALWVEYDNGAIAWLSDHVNQLSCLFAQGAGASAVEIACGLPQVDCGLGIATWGHSQGALIAHLARDYDERVRVAWLTGYGGDNRATLSKDRLRVVNGEADTSNGTVSVLNAIAGFTPSECPDDGRTQCLRADGSGWIVVQRADCQRTTADHCWFDKVTCTDATTVLEPNWIDRASTKPFALELNADWVRATLHRP